MKTQPCLAVLALAGAALSPLAAAPDVATSVAPVNIQATRSQIEFQVGKELVSRYNLGPDVAKPYLWPVLGPGGMEMTRRWPMEKAQAGGSTDHVHQKSAWFCHGDVIPEGMELKDRIKNVEGVDFWSEARGHGRIVTTSVGSARQDRNHGQVTTRNEWQTADGTKVLDETRTIHFYNFGVSQLFVFDSDLYASVAPLTFGDTKEGSFGIRINDRIRAQGGKGRIENADGKVGEKDCWGQVSKWCDYSGPLPSASGQEKVAGLAILDDPSNPYPACWHSRNYGLMAANPFGRAKSGFPAMKAKTELVKMKKGEHLKFRYGLLIHPGDARGGKVGEFYDRFVKLKG